MSFSRWWLGTGKHAVAGMALAAFGLALAPAVARAQAAVRSSGRVPEIWVLTLGVQEAWEKNIRNRANTENDTDFSTRVVGTLTHSYVGPRLTLGITADGSGNFFREETTLNRFNYTGAVGMGYQFSPHTSFNLRESLTSTYTTDLVGFDDEGEILELTLVRRNRASAGLGHQISNRSTLSLSARHDYVDFDSEVAIDGKRYGGGLDLARRFGPDTIWTWAANVSRSERRGTASDVGVTTLGVRHTFNSTWSMGLNGGLSQIWAEGESATRWNAQADLTRRLERSSLTLGYARRVGQAFGLGREREYDIYRLGYEKAIGTRCVVVGAFAYSVSRDPFDEAFSLNTQNYTAGFTYSLNPEWRFGGTYLYRRRTSGGQNVDGQRALVSLLYRKAWR